MDVVRDCVELGVLVCEREFRTLTDDARVMSGGSLSRSEEVRRRWCADALQFDDVPE